MTGWACNLDEMTAISDDGLIVKFHIGHLMRPAKVGTKIFLDDNSAMYGILQNIPENFDHTLAKRMRQAGDAFFKTLIESPCWWSVRWMKCKSGLTAEGMANIIGVTPNHFRKFLLAPDKKAAVKIPYSHWALLKITLGVDFRDR